MYRVRVRPPWWINLDVPAPAYNAKVFEKDQQLISQRNMSLAEIEALSGR